MITVYCTGAYPIVKGWMAMACLNVSVAFNVATWNKFMYYHLIETFGLCLKIK